MQILINAQTRGLNTALAQSSSALKGLEGAITTTNKALGAFGIAIGAGVVANIAGDIIQVTAQFEKFGAVLANTLGSQSAAQAALDSIREFAQETPFEVSEVTAAYVRWANQGLNPTIDKMGKLGDVASSLGAGFEQTAEAFKDLLVGQTKRIEEIGISAQQSNGKIQLSFKGVNLEIEKTVEGVEEALNVFSALEGVQGTSAQVSETLGGRISNLKDAYSNLLLTIGTGNSGVLKEGTNLLIDLTNAATNLIKKLTSTDNTFGRFVDFVVKSQLAPTKFMLSLIDGADETNKKLAESAEKLRVIQSTADAAFASGNIEAYIKALDQNINKEEIIAEIRRRQAEEIAKTNAARATEIVSLDSLKLKLDELNKQFEETDSKDKATLNNIGQQILATNAQIEALERLRKKHEEVAKASLSAFGQKQLEDATLGSGRIKEEELRRTRTAEPITGDALSDFELPFEDPDRLARVIDNLKTYSDAVQTAGVSAIKSTEQQILAHEQVVASQERITNTALEFGEAIGSAVGNAIQANKNFVGVIKSVAAAVLPKLLAMALAGTIAGAGKTALPPPVIVALAAAGVAAMTALFRSATGTGGGGGGGAIGGGTATTNVQRLAPVASQAESISFDAKFRLEGKDLVASVNSTNNAGGRLGG